MNKKDLLFPAVFGLLALVFAGITLAVFLTKGRSAKWINRKMKIGALMLGLTVALSGNAQEHDSLIDISCYDVVSPNSMRLLNTYSNEININKESNVLKGEIWAIETNEFSYLIKDSSGKKVISKNIMALDGSFDTHTENFELQIKKNLKPGKYTLLLYAVDKSAQKRNNFTARYILKVEPLNMCYF